jgi:hypothetical protein
MPKPPARDSETARLRHAIRKVLPPVPQKLYQLAIAGDVQAARLLLDRALPPLQPVRDAVLIDGDTPQAMKADLLAKVAGGEIAPREAPAVLELLSRLPAGKGERARSIDGEALALIRERLYGKGGDAQN